MRFDDFNYSNAVLYHKHMLKEEGDVNEEEEAVKQKRNFDVLEMLEENYGNFDFFGESKEENEESEHPEEKIRVFSPYETAREEVKIQIDAEASSRESEEEESESEQNEYNLNQMRIRSIKFDQNIDPFAPLIELREEIQNHDSFSEINTLFDIKEMIRNYKEPLPVISKHETSEESIRNFKDLFKKMISEKLSQYPHGSSENESGSDIEESFSNLNKLQKEENQMVKSESINDIEKVNISCFQVIELLFFRKEMQK
jgi:predicted RND superfamily exporter protein